MKILLLFRLLLLSVIIAGCAANLKQTPQNAAMDIIDISQGLPAEGLWRQDITLFDVNGDGFPDIIAPPPRKADEKMNKPFIFLWDPMNKKWTLGDYEFPKAFGYNYGMIAVGDIDGNGYADLALANHGGRIIILQNNGKGGFTEAMFPAVKDFHSRTIALTDINGDGRLDVIAFSESPTTRLEIKRGILIGINKGDNKWDINIVSGSERIFGDSMAVIDINKDGFKDIVIAPMTSIEEDKLMIWLGDGLGGFKLLETDFAKGRVPFMVRGADIDGDGKDDLMFLLAGVGVESKSIFRSIKWTGTGFANLLPDLELTPNPIAFDLRDIDGDGKAELFVISPDGLHIFKHNETGWQKITYYPMSEKDTLGVYNLRVSKHIDNKWLIVFNMGSENPLTNKGLKAYILEAR